VVLFLTKNHRLGGLRLYVNDGRDLIMAQRYQAIVRPWAIYRTGLSQSICVARFKSRVDADGHLAILKRTNENYTIMYDPKPDEN
jgi:hypothetical protein